MKMIRETTAGSVGGSITTVVPSILVELLALKKGDKIVWEIETLDNRIVVGISPKEETE